jgi:hypothetical protein
MGYMDHTDQRGAHIDGVPSRAAMTASGLHGATQADIFSQLAVEMHAADGVEQTVDAVVQFALRALDCSYAGIAQHTKGDRPEIPAVTDPVVAEIYQFQLDGHDDDEAIAHILARHASVAVSAARQEETMATAVDARKLVGQAMGILMERFDVDGDRAFAILRRYSQDTNTKLRDVARQLIKSRQLPH